MENNEKILKIFNNVRCLNRDQFPRYLDGRLTDVEKHLVEQHLVDCDLCFDALQVLQQSQYRERYQPLSTGILQYIRNSIKQVSHVHKVERYQRQEQKKESFLIYFWAVAAIVIVAGVVYAVQQQRKFKPAIPRVLANAVNVATPPKEEVTSLPAAPVPPVQAAVMTPVRAAADSSSRKPVQTHPAASPTVKPAKDSVKAVVKPPVAPVKKDTVKKHVPPPVVHKPVEVKEPEKEKMHPPVEHKEMPSQATYKTEDTADKTDKSDKPEPDKTNKTEVKPPVKKDSANEGKPTAPATPNGTDEFLYKAAMVYHQQGNLNEAISRYKHLSSSSGRYGELSRYQLAVCYRSKGQTGKAKRMFKDVIRMNGSMKDKAQAALDTL